MQKKLADKAKRLSKKQSKKAGVSQRIYQP
jgi:hypothetical protein